MADGKDGPKRNPWRAHLAGDRVGAYQKHHVIPGQLFRLPVFQRLMSEVALSGFVAGDFERNGLFLPADEETALLARRPMHRGPHLRYNEMVIERVGRIERDFAATPDRERAANDALFRLTLLQRTLRRTLDSPAPWTPLNRRDPMSRAVDFTDLDAMADLLWQATG